MLDSMTLKKVMDIFTTRTHNKAIHDWVAIHAYWLIGQRHKGEFSKFVTPILSPRKVSIPTDPCLKALQNEA
ncbi:hypothetical protein L596_022124 [Steinernema carpocapsae]|uniref:Uncharacterized protein n=1 Tax=Steinernema carpocapsae TaxID=34508 RepID=A0A4V6A044_STECR|nr:hypothetical protein L596_022124 [Steinernema carpocapsae]